ncbi:chemotaxis protein CheB [Polyangium aurulentum]|uniref:chemotaxis protein CheB n=1 Tax=Polyangium aurulentum TaxID=2567896 RepID=UPI001469DC89|nr:chemotaxis protein CheB [Polyangium aurulentum]UQA55456.1 PAS domain-containing protein [Polyangium aurulentum]
MHRKRPTSGHEERRFDVVGLVTSLGGLEALGAVLRELPPDFPVPVVVFQHLSAQGSQLAPLLGRRTRLPVSWAADGQRLAPGEIKVAPPGSRLEIMPDGTFSLSPGEPSWRDMPLDVFLESLADSFGRRALAVVLTGLGKDGSVGARKLKDAGGTVLVQSEDTAEASSMPRAAIENGAADLVLPLHDIGKVIREVVAGARLPRPHTEIEAAEALFSGPGEVRQLLRAMDWSSTLLGPITGWPEALRLMVRTTLDSAYPMAVWWGPQLVQIYNEGWRQFLGKNKHPAALAGRARETWAEAWDVIGPMIERVRTRGEAVGDEDFLLWVERNGYLEECYFTFSYAPIRDAAGAVVGVHNTGWETTQRVVAERRMRALRALAAQVAGAATPREACELAAAALASDPADVPFALLYLLDDTRRQATLAGAAGLEGGSFAAPRLLDVTDKSEGPAWPLWRALVGTGGGVLLDDLGDRFRSLPPPASAATGSLPPRAAFLLPLRAAADEPPMGVLVVGLSPHRPFDDDYRSFLDLVVGQLGGSLAQARARQRERERIDRLAELDRTKTEFFSNVSHEFRTPLTLLLGPLEELLRHREDLPAPLVEDVEVAARNSRRLLTLVNTLLDFSQIEAGRIRVHFEPTDLAALTKDIASVFRSAAKRAGLKLTVKCPPLPQPVWADRSMWEKIVSNLLSNALKFTFEGRIHVELRALPYHVELTVRDTGVGIPADEIPHLFKRFHRVRGTQARTQEGSGIGLAFAHELVRLHQGRMRVTSEEGQGSAFVVWIPSLPRRASAPWAEEAAAKDPVKVAAALAEEAVQWSAESAAVPAALVRDEPLGPPKRRDLQRRAPGARVLVVDDNADMRAYLQRLLSPHWSVLVAPDGEQALALARRDRPDLILADVMMPRLDGFGLLRAVRGDEALKHTPVVFLTARAGEETAIEGLLAGADDYLAKPFSARELVARVGGQIELSRVRRRAAELNAFRVRLSDALRSASDPLQMQATACRLLGEQLGVDRCWISEVFAQQGISRIDSEHHRPDLPPMSGVFQLSEYPETMSQLATQRMVLQDAANDPRFSDSEKELLAGLHLQALLVVPLRKGPRQVLWALAAAMATPRHWTEEEMALVEETAERTWAAVERARAEDARRASEERLRSLFETMSQGVAIMQLVRDDAGNVVDTRYLELNPAFERLTGFDRAAVAGRRTSEVFPLHFADFQPRLATVEGTAGPERFETFIPEAGRWFSFYAAPFGGPDGFVVFFDDITERKQAEQALRASEERQAFLLRFSDALRDEPDADAIATAALRLLVAELGVDRCYVTTMDPASGLAAVPHQVATPGVLPVPAVIHMHDYPAQLRRIYDGMLVVHDAATEPGLTARARASLAAIQFGALVAATLRRVEDGERRPIWGVVAVSAAPRRWTQDEVALVVEVAERTWAAMERARAEAALGASEEKYRSLFETMDEGFALCELVRDADGRVVDYRYVDLNPALVRHGGISPDALRGRRATEAFPNLDRGLIDTYARVVGERASVLVERHFPHVDRWLRINAFPRGGDRFAVLYSDITARKQAEEVLRESEARQAFLLKLSDALRARSDESSIRELAVHMLAEHLRLDRCYISEVFEQQGFSTVGPEQVRPDLPAMAGVYRLSDYPETMRQLATQPMVIGDAADDPRFSDSEKELLAGLHLRALLVVALRKGQRQVLWALAAAMATPRHWTDGERVLLEEVAERTWAAVERARAEAVAARAERRAEAILERMGDAHCILDRDFRIESVNAATERLLGVPRTALVGHSHWDVFPASVDAPVGRALRRVVAEGVEQHLTHHYTGEGYDMHLEVDAYPTDEGGVAMFWRDVTERVRAELALRASEEKYRALFNEMDEAYAVVEVIADAAGRWTDFLFLEVNPAFMRHTGMPYPVGRTATELLGTPNPRWAELYGRAAQTGESIRLEEAELTLGRVFDLNIFRLGGEGSRRVAVLFTDITARKQAEEALRESKARQAFLLQLSDALRAEPDADAVANRAIRMLSEQMQLDRCYITSYRLEDDRAEVTHQVGNDRGPPLPDAIRLSDFPAALRVTSDRTLVIEDDFERQGLSEAEERSSASLGMRALVAPKLRKGDNDPLWSMVAISARPRRWTRGEIALVEEVAERTWAAMERARAE